MRFLAWTAALLAAVIFSVPSGASDITPRGRIAAPAAPAAPPYLPAPVKEWSWTGAYVGLGVGGLGAIHNLNVEHGELDARLNGLGAWDYLGDAKVGFDYQPSGQPFVFGVFAGYSLGSATVEGRLNGQGFDLEVEPTWNVGARVGLIGPNKSLVYVGYKFQEADFSLRGTGGLDLSGVCSGALRCSNTLQGHGLIAGFEMPVTSMFTMALEYGYTPFDTENISKVEGTRLDVDTEVHSLMLRGNVRVGPNLF